MIRLTNLSVHRSLIEKLEVLTTIFWLLYFMGVALPSPFTKLIRAGSYLIIAILVALHWRRLSWVATRDLPLLLLVGAAMASYFWSADSAKTLDTMKALVRMFLFGAYFTTRYSIKEQMKILTWVFGIGTILSLVTAIAVPSYGISSTASHGGAYTGIFPYKNFLGYSMVLSAITFVIVALKNKKPNWLAWSGFVLAVALIVMARSTASLICLLTLLSLMPLYQFVQQHFKWRVVLLSLGCVLASIISIFILGSLENILVDDLGENPISRISIWILIIEKCLERPWLGYGYDGFWSSDAGFYVISNTWASDQGIRATFNAHSGYMELFSNLGFLGVSLYAISLLTVFIRVVVLLFSTRKIEFFWLLQFLVFLGISNLADSVSILSGSSSYWAIYVAICLSTAIEYRRMKMNKNYYLETEIDRLV